MRSRAAVWSGGFGGGGATGAAVGPAWHATVSVAIAIFEIRTA